MWKRFEASKCTKIKSKFGDFQVDCKSSSFVLSSCSFEIGYDQVLHIKWKLRLSIFYKCMVCATSDNKRPPKVKCLKESFINANLYCSFQSDFLERLNTKIFDGSFEQKMYQNTVLTRYNSNL